MQDFGIGKNSGFRQIRHTKTLIIDTGKDSGQKSPFEKPDIYVPTPNYPTYPSVSPEFPIQPKWLPESPSGPFIEIPMDFPMELPPFEQPGEIKPSPKEFPDWSKQPLHLPPFEQPEWITPSPKEIPDWGRQPLDLPHGTGESGEVPKHFEFKKDVDGGWLLG